MLIDDLVLNWSEIHEHFALEVDKYVACLLLCVRVYIVDGVRAMVAR